ncbi:MAG: hypothetical protein ACF8CQ_16670 [Rhodopirellula sp. JB044]|uniref:hypothetical protein n=1 Tax=Rhodopirellula sp. JB044 TaxID=3342844 RepID=UPI00370AC123
MNVFHRRSRVVCPLGVLLGLMFAGGCGIEPETISRIEQMSMQKSSAFASMDQPPELDVTRTSGEGFVVPFPDRQDPFQIVRAGAAPQNKKITASNISVVGFAKLKEQQAILKIDDQSRFVVVGDTVGEVEVLAITPPRVRLRNGNLVWDVSMFQNR